MGVRKNNIENIKLYFHTIIHFSKAYGDTSV